MAEEEPASAQIGQKASEMASQIELTARDLARVGHEATALAGSLARKVANVVGSHPEDAEASEISQQVQELVGAMQKTTEDALRIAQKAVEMASKIAQVPAGGSSTPPGGSLRNRAQEEWPVTAGAVLPDDRPRFRGPSAGPTYPT